MTGFGVYVHWPYCTSICPYCDFNVYRPRGADPEPLIDAIRADIAGHAERFPQRGVTSVFFGGGTPSLLSGGQIGRLLEAIDKRLGLAGDCEVSLEANPEDAPRFAEQVRAGINRLSIGVQSTSELGLVALGRRHTAPAAAAAVAAGAATGARVSIDLIYAWQGQSHEAWREEIDSALALPVEHVSLYQLTIEPGTAFERRVRRGQLSLPDECASAEFYELTQAACEQAGFVAYEVSNHARDAAARSRHNLVYWRGGDWIGVGPGAHGRMTRGGARWALEAQRRPKDYVDSVREYGVGWIEEASLTGEEAADEILLMGLRIDEGVELARVEALRGRSINRAALDWLSQQKLVSAHEGIVRLTARGRILANKIALELLA